MTVSLHVFLLVAALVLLILAAVGVSGRIATGWAGLACLVAALIFNI